MRRQFVKRLHGFCLEVVTQATGGIADARHGSRRRNRRRNRVPCTADAQMPGSCDANRFCARYFSLPHDRCLFHGSMSQHVLLALLQGLHFLHIDLPGNVFVHGNRCLTELDHIGWPSLVQLDQAARYQSHGGQPVQAGMRARRDEHNLCLFAGRQVGKRSNERFYLLTKHGTAFPPWDRFPIG